VPTIAHLREKIEAIRLEQIAKSDTFEMEAISRAIVNQILHHPTVQLKATKDYEILRQQAVALRTLFNLDPLVEPQDAKRAKKICDQARKITESSLIK